MSKALYRKYRSKTLNEIVGQKHITDILSRSIKQGKISHAYLLTGPRGVGKTSIARILAHEINNLKYDENNTNLDIIEIDAASNNGVEDVRDLREKVQIAPVSAIKKIYIIDEVHMLSKAAFNALLKTLEEPPEHVVFILATTNVEKLPATIISRTQRYSFRPISIENAVKHLAFIAKEEEINISEEALKLIAERSDGSFRDSISLLDQLSGMTDETITLELIEDILGLAPNKSIDQILKAIESHDIKSLVDTLNNMMSNGVNGITIASQLIESIRSQITEKPELLPLIDSLIDVPKSPQPDLKILSVLGLATRLQKQPVKSVALATPVLEISASVEELRKTPMPTTKREIKAEPIIELKPKKIKNNSNVSFEDSDWDKLIDYARQNYVALFSVLSKCNYEINGDTLTIFTVNKFYKKKLDDTKYSPILSKCLQEIGINDLNIDTIPTVKPSKDSKITAITDIMGGGEEVKLESV